MVLHLKQAPKQEPSLRGGREDEGGGTISIVFSSLEDEELPSSVDLSAMSTSTQHVVRVFITNGEISISPFIYGQSKLRMAGEVSVGKRLFPSAKEGESSVLNIILLLLAPTLFLTPLSLVAADGGVQFSGTHFFQTLRGARQTLEAKQPSTSNFLGVLPPIGRLLSGSANDSSLINSSAYTRHGTVTDAVKKFKKVPVLLFKLFQNQAKVDEANYGLFVENIKSVLPLSKIEEAVIGGYDEIMRGGGFKNLAGAGRNAVLMSRRQLKDDRHPWGRAKATIHASATRILAYIMCFDAHERVQAFR